MQSQVSLPFDITAGRHKGNPLSREANASIHGNKQRVREQIFEYARKQGFYGVTADEVVAAWECSVNHVAPRISELAMQGLLLPAGRRKTRSGRNAQVWIARKEAA